MTHPLAEAYDKAEDERLTKLLRFQAQNDLKGDLKMERLLRQAANRIEELSDKLKKSQSEQG